VISKLDHLAVLYIQQMKKIIVDFIKIRSKNLVKANLWLALYMFNFSPKIKLDYAYKYTDILYS